MCGAEAQFEIEYQGVDPLRNVHISMAFLDVYGDGVLYLSNDIAGCSFERIAAVGSLVCKFERLPLLPGSYTVNLYCTVNGIQADWVRDAARVNIENGDFYGSGKLPPAGYGSVAVAHDWIAK